MIRTFRRQFITIAMCAMAGSIVIMLLLINGLNLAMTIEELRGTLVLISENNGSMPSFSEKKKPSGPRLNRESQYETRYFSVLFDPSGEASAVNVSQIAAVDRDDAVLYAQQAAAAGKDFGFLNSFIYHVSHSPSGKTRVCFLDWQNKQRSLFTFAVSSALMGAAGLAATFIIVLRLSARAVQPLLLSTAKQKQFITDASHELKTPLSVIAVNMDVLAMDVGENEWIASTQQQVRSLRRLVDHLVSISRMDEQGAEFEKKTFSLSDAALDTAAPFAAIARAQGKVFTCAIPENIRITGNEELIRQMLGVLCDNAVKYAAAPGDIRLELADRRRQCELRISNRYIPAEGGEDLDRMFDRFYRADASRSRDSASTGFGVGLSIAQKVVQWHQGRISVSMAAPEVICFQVTLPHAPRIPRPAASSPAQQKGD